MRKPSARIKISRNFGSAAPGRALASTWQNQLPVRDCQKRCIAETLVKLSGTSLQKSQAKSKEAPFLLNQPDPPVNEYFMLKVFHYRTHTKLEKSWFMLLKRKHLRLKVCIFGYCFCGSPLPESNFLEILGSCPEPVGKSFMLKKFFTTEPTQNYEKVGLCCLNESICA